MVQYLPNDLSSRSILISAPPPPPQCSSSTSVSTPETGDVDVEVRTGVTDLMAGLKGVVGFEVVDFEKLGFAA
jgi:hypothetical protein